MNDLQALAERKRGIRAPRQVIYPDTVSTIKTPADGRLSLVSEEDEI